MFCVLDHPPYRELIDTDTVRIVLVVDALSVKNTLLAFDDLQHTCVDAYNILSELRKREVTLQINHVPAHNNEGTPRSWGNNWCDREAKKQMRRLRDGY